MGNVNEAVYWVWLAEALGQGNKEASILFESVTHPQEVYENNDITPDSYTSERFGKLKAETIARLRNKELENAGNIVASCVRNEIRILPCKSSRYPARLRKLPDFPTLLYYRGNASLLSAKTTVGVVGTRYMTEYGKAATFDIVKTLCLYDIVTVSGAAIGVDSMANSTSRNFGRQTIAVLGNGLDDPYPRENLPLINDMCRENLVISEYPPGSKPEGKHFPVRNRIISGLSDAVLVVEGDKRSGALITARLAEKYEKPVYAVPGSIYSSSSSGTNELLRKGGRICLTGEEIIADFSETIELKRLESIENSALYQRCASVPKSRINLVQNEIERNIPQIPELVRKSDTAAKSKVDSDSGKNAAPSKRPAASKDEIIKSMWDGIDASKERLRERNAAAQSVDEAAEQVRESASAPSEEAAAKSEAPAPKVRKIDPEHMTANDHVLSVIGDDEALRADTIAERCGMPIDKVLPILTMLEITSDVEFQAGGVYKKVSKER